METGQSQESSAERRTIPGRNLRARNYRKPARRGGMPGRQECQAGTPAGTQNPSAPVTVRAAVCLPLYIALLGVGCKTTGRVQNAKMKNDRIIFCARLPCWFDHLSLAAFNLDDQQEFIS